MTASSRFSSGFSASGFRLWRFRFFVALVLSAVLMLGAVSTGWIYINSKWAQANDIDLDLDSGPARNFLLLGSDSREFVESERDRESFGQVGGQRADTVIVVRIDPSQDKALLVSFPRDLWVEIPGSGFSRINSAFTHGPQGVIDTLRHNFDIPVHHYVQIDFAGFRNLVEAMGGVEMYVEAPARDFKTGLNIEQAGCTTLDGAQALAWVRSRNFERFESGTWRSDPTGDFGRVNRQQDFLRRLIAQAVRAGASNPIRGDRMVDRALENLTVDSSLGVRDVLRLVDAFRSADPDEIEMVSVPADVGRRGSASVVIARPEAEQVYERLRGRGTDGEVAPSSVTVRVLNGVGAAGIATQTAGELTARGFQPGGLGDADRFDYTTTEIRYRPGAEEKAAVVQEFVQGAGELIEDSSIGSVDVLLIVGADFQGVRGDSDEPEEAFVPATGETLRLISAALVEDQPVHGQDEGGGDGGDDGDGADGEPEPAGSDPSPEC